MIYFIILVILTVTLGLLSNNRLITKRSACIVISFFAIILYGIRNDTVGNVDIPRYVNTFTNLMHLDLVDILDFKKDFAFYYFSKLVSLITSSYNVWFTLIGILLIFNVSKLIMKYTNSVILPYLIFFTFIFPISFSLLRHVCALAFVIQGYIAIKENKKTGYIYLFIATLCHLSSIVTFLFFLLKRVKFGKWNIYLIIAALLISGLVPDLLSKIVNLINIERFSHYGESSDIMTLTYTAFFLNLIFLILVALLLFFKRGVNIQKYSFELNIFSIGVVFYAFVGVLAEFYRIAMFFSFILIVLLPNALNEYKSSKSRQLIDTISFLFGISLIVYFFTIVLYDAQLLPFNINADLLK